jgi:phage terminase large subunit
VFDFKHPDYKPIFQERLRRLRKLRAEANVLAELKVYYRAHPIDFIADWGITEDARNLGTARPVLMPFVLFPKQRELLEWLMERWKSGEPGIIVKSRDVGASWLAMALSCTLCLFHNRTAIGVGSAAEKKLDESGNPDTLFYKARAFVHNLPTDFKGTWNYQRDTPYMRMLFPDTNSSITGEAGDKIGRGGRKAIYFVDESAHLERPQLAEASLATNTNCRIDMSSVRGTNNPFAEKARAGKIKKFDFGWRSDPRKDDAWYEKQQNDLDPVTLAQEIDCDFQASVEGIVIPSAWVSAAMDAHLRLEIPASGAQSGSLDVADEGVDKNAFGTRHGNTLMYAESWSGKGTDIYDTTVRAFHLCDQFRLTAFSYDGDGLGAGVRGDAARINQERKLQGLRVLTVTAFRGSEGVLDPERTVANTDRKNIDFFENRKSQCWWALRFRFQATYNAVVKRLPFKADDIISINSDFPEVTALCRELSQPTYGLSKAGKILIEKKPDGAKSPNLADVAMQLFAPVRPPMIINPLLLESRNAAPTSSPLAHRQRA